MYCSHCGSQTADNLNFCKNCGARNEHRPLVTTGPSLRRLLVAAVALGAVGITGFFPILRELLRSGVDPTAMVVLLIAYLATVLLMFAILVGHIWKNTGEPQIKGSGQETPYRDQYFRGVNTAQLPEPMDRPASVTEHTTRTLDEIPVRER